MAYKPTLLLATVDTLPGKSYQVLGIVSGTTRSISGNADLGGAYKDMEDQARKLGAQAIIGVRVTTAPTNGLFGKSQMFTTVIGSAVKFAS